VHLVRNVLVVDDHRDTCRLLVKLLELAGYPALCIGDGAAALASIAAHLPAMVFLDVMMPGLDGFDVLRALRAAPASHRLPVVMYTAVSDDASADRARHLGADEYVVKGRMGYAELRALALRYAGSPN
jgi:CheY-like chemotaxis protein